MQKANFFLAIFLVHCLIVGIAGAKTNITTDQSSLLTLKAQLHLDPSHILLNNWSDSTPVCAWIAVTCGLRHQRVTALDISGMNLTGRIPSHLGNLSFLISIDFSHNDFSGDLPQELIKLRRLQIISFRFNSLSGQIPSWLFSFLSKLQVLDLRNNIFTGVIPPSIANMSDLQIVDLANNLLQGNIPEGIGNLPNLKQLFLRGNNLTGAIPLPIFNISTLEFLALGTNSLSGDLPPDICHGLPRLIALSLSFNELTGNFPSNLSKCSQLQLLELTNNTFGGSIPTEIGQIRTLRFLHLSGNGLTGKIPEELGNLENLVQLDLGNNFLMGSIPDSIFNISSLQRIRFYRCNLSGMIPTNVVANSSQLIELDLTHNNLSGPIPNFFGDLRFLEVVSLQNNNFINETPELSFITSFTKCQFLRKLNFPENPLSGTLPVSVGNFSTSLLYIYGYKCDIWGSIPNEVGNLSNLIAISLYDNQLMGSIPASLGNLQKLQALSLTGNKISGYIPHKLCELRYLDSLLLSDNLIAGAIPECIENITAIRYLSLDTNRLTSGIPASLWLKNDLLELTLSSNFLTGSLPPEIGNLKVATLIDLSFNQFSGSIPTTIGDLHGLINLSLAHNIMQGFIPKSMGKLLNLERLDLSYNNLSGNIPKSLEVLRYLTNLNVSFNDLSGEVPSGGPFINFSSQSYMSNNRLCSDQIYGLPRCRSIGDGRQKRKKLMLGVLFAILVFIVAMTLAYAVRRYQRKKIVETRAEPGTEISRFSQHELIQATQGYSKSRLLGSGSFGSVYKGTLNNGKEVAVKVFNLQQQNAFKSFDIECEVLRNLRHRNLCKIVSTCSNPDFKALILEYMPNGSLDKWLYSDDCFLDILQRINIMIDVACALEYLHYDYSSTPIVHCDLKPSNILLDEEMVAHLSDFGIAKLLGDEQSNEPTKTLGTLGYIAPEYGFEGLVSIRCDVYSYGITLMEVFTRTKPSSERFSGDLSLRSWVNDSMPNAITRVIDSNLLMPKEEEYEKKLKCVYSIMELALNCSMESAKKRVNMKDVVVALKKIKSQLLA